MNERTIDPILPLLWRRRLALSLGVGIGIAFGLTYALASPKWFEAQISVVPGQQNQKGPAGLAQAAAMSADLPVDLGLGGTDADRIQAVMRSVSVTDAVIEKFHLLNRYKKHYIEHARKALWIHCTTKIEKKPAVVTLTCEDTDPQVAQSMTEYFGEIANKVFRRISTSTAGEERRFLEQRVSEAATDIDEASRRLRAFQERYRIIDLGEQSKAVVSAIATLKGELLSKELQLGYLSTFSSSDEVTATQLRQQLGVMREKLHSLEESAPPPSNEPTLRNSVKEKKRRDGDGGLFPPALDVPKIRYELEQLYRAQKIQETLFLLLTQRYEMAKVNEARDTSTFQILDHATLPTYKTRPKMSVCILVGALAGMLAAALWISRQRWRARLSELMQPPQHPEQG